MSVSPFFSSKFLEEIYQISISKRKANTLLICLYFSTVLFVLCHILLFSVCRCKVTNNFPSGKIFMPLHRKKNGSAARRSGLAEGGLSSTGWHKLYRYRYNFLSPGKHTQTPQQPTENQNNAHTKTPQNRANTHMTPIWRLYDAYITPTPKSTLRRQIISISI